MTFSARMKEVSVYLEFDLDLQTLTGTASERIRLSDETPFIMLLQAVLDTYPQLVEKYASSSLSFSINGESPDWNSTLRENDVISILLSGSQFDDKQVNYMKFKQ